MEAPRQLFSFNQRKTYGAEHLPGGKGLNPVLLQLLVCIISLPDVSVDGKIIIGDNVHFLNQKAVKIFLQEKFGCKCLHILCF